MFEDIDKRMKKITDPSELRSLMMEVSREFIRQPDPGEDVKRAVLKVREEIERRSIEESKRREIIRKYYLPHLPPAVADFIDRTAPGYAIDRIPPLPEIRPGEHPAAYLKRLKKFRKHFELIK